jgi:hypothetical protein
LRWFSGIAKPSPALLRALFAWCGQGPIKHPTAPTFGRKRTRQAPELPPDARRKVCLRSICTRRISCSVLAIALRAALLLDRGRLRHEGEARRGPTSTPSSADFRSENELDRCRAAARFASKGMLARHMHTAHIVLGAGDRARPPCYSQSLAPARDEAPRGAGPLAHPTVRTFGRKTNSTGVGLPSDSRRKVCLPGICIRRISFWCWRSRCQAALLLGGGRTRQGGEAPRGRAH